MTRSSTTCAGRSPAAEPRRTTPVTERELEVFGLIARGHDNDTIAPELVVSEATVKTHVNRIRARLGGRNRVKLVVLAYETGLCGPASADVVRRAGAPRSRTARW